MVICDFCIVYFLRDVGHKLIFLIVLASLRLALSDVKRPHTFIYFIVCVVSHDYILGRIC